MWNDELSFTADCTINFDLLKQLSLPDVPKYDITYVKVVQARKHRKKRINKKWLKRYGYKQIYVISKGWKMNMRTDGTYEFVKNGVL